MNIQDIDKSFHNIFKNFNLKKKNSYLGVYLPESFKKLNLNKYNKCCLILFIDNISENLGHFITIVKINKKKIIFIDSYGKKPNFYNESVYNNFFN